jgi:hypothetical protein
VEAVPSGDDDRVKPHIVQLAHPRHGHFDLGTGFHGDVWLEVPVAIATLLSLGQAGETTPAALSVPLYGIDTMQSQAWPADECPLCASDTPLTDPSSQT